IALFTFVVLAGTSEVARAGQQPSPVTPPSSDITPADQQGTPPSGAPLRLTLQDALERARKNSTGFQGAVTDAGLAREDRTQARDALLPSVLYINQVIYSQSNQAGSIRFIANNAVHEYLSQGNVHEVFDFTSFNNFSPSFRDRSGGSRQGGCRLPRPRSYRGSKILCRGCSAAEARNRPKKLRGRRRVLEVDSGAREWRRSCSL